MRPKTTWLCIGAACLAMAVPSPTHAQQSIVLRYRPQPRTRVHTLWWIQGRTTLREGAPEVTALDSIMVETELLRSLTSQVLEERGDYFVVRVRHDSTRGRARPVGGVWRDIPGLGDRVTEIQMLVDARLRVADLQVTAGDSLTPFEIQVLRGYASSLEFTLPDSAIAAGDTWTADIVLPVVGARGFGEETPVAQQFVDQPEVIARSAFTVDSLVPRSSDTLAYLTVQGGFVPAVAPVEREGVRRTLTLTGAFGGSLIWSTGWNAFVAGAFRTRATTTAVGGEGGAVTLRSEVSSRFQVRP
jgi:hypothetical protein